MKLLHDCIYDPLEQTKRTLWCFARITIHSVSGCSRRFSGKLLKQKERLKGIRLFSDWKHPGRNSDFMSSNLFWILVSGFRGRFSLNETEHPRHYYMGVTSRKFVISAVEKARNLMCWKMIQRGIIYGNIWRLSDWVRLKNLARHYERQKTR